jgi:hypothetical protein
MKPPFPLIAESRNLPTSDGGDPWWFVSLTPLKLMPLIVYHGPWDQFEERTCISDWGVDFEKYAAIAGQHYFRKEGFTAFFAAFFHPWDEAILAHELVHVADDIKATYGFKGTEFRATMTEQLFNIVRKVRQDKCTPNFKTCMGDPAHEYINAVIKKNRRMDK